MNMDQLQKINLFRELLEELEKLEYNDDLKMDAIFKKAKMRIRNIFDPESNYIKDLNRISFWPGFAPSSEQDRREYWKSGKEKTKNLFFTIIEELEIFISGSVNEKPHSKELSKDIFIVHGHDDAMKISVARIVEKLGLNPIILHEKPSKGRTIIEKFTDYSNVTFAIILLSPDDMGYDKKVGQGEAKYRARQNVIFELGYFLGKLGRTRVLALFREEKDFEIPSDYSGVLFVPFTDTGRWQIELVKELKACGYNVDANQIL
jgi:hypothetical protein